jgi:hypothetical protein
VRTPERRMVATTSTMHGAEAREHGLYASAHGVLGPLGGAPPPSCYNTLLWLPEG